MARVNLLNGFDDLSMIDTFARRFSQHPDEVCDNTPFGTVVNFLEMWKEQDEYQERFNFFWQDAHKEAK